jgi:hypothetical protein
VDQARAPSRESRKTGHAGWTLTISAAEVAVSAMLDQTADKEFGIVHQLHAEEEKSQACSYASLTPHRVIKGLY